MDQHHAFENTEIAKSIVGILEFFQANPGTQFILEKEIIVGVSLSENVPLFPSH